MNEHALSTEVTPMSLLEVANQKGASVEQLQQLMELQLRWEANEARKAYNEAIAKFKAKGVKITKDHVVDFSSSRGRTHYKHATLGNVVEKVTPVMSKYGLSHTWDVKQDQTGIEVTCKLAHVKGHAETVTIKAEADNTGNKNSIQQIGSTVTYLQRYTLLSALGLATYDEDDDGQASEPKQEETITEDQAADLRALIAEVKAKEDGFCTVYKIAQVEDLPAKWYEHAVKALEAKRGRA